MVSVPKLTASHLLTMSFNERVTFGNKIFCFLYDVVYQDEIGEEIEEEDSYLDLAGMKQQTQMNVSRFHSH